MLPESLEGLFPFHENEVIRKFYDSISYFPEAKQLNEEDRTLVFTNRRLVFIRKKFSGLLIKVFDGYDSDIDEWNITSFQGIEVSKRLKHSVTIFTPAYKMDFGIQFSSKSELDNFLYDLSSDIEVDMEDEVSMVKCRKCGYELEEDYVACPKCGLKLKATKSDIAEIVFTIISIICSLGVMWLIWHYWL